METSLHRQLKEMYAGDDAQLEVPLAGYRIDAINKGRLVEIQHGPLSVIRDKIRRLLEEHHVLIVKPLIVEKTLVKQDAKGGRVIGRRKSPKHGSLLDLFDELVHFTRVFPHKRLVIEAVLVTVEEWRYPGHGRRRWRRPNDHQIEDQRLVEVREVHRFRTAGDLRRLLPRRLPRPFHTGHLAERMDIDRWVAQRITYCLRNMGSIRAVGKKGNAHLYEFVAAKRAA